MCLLEAPPPGGPPGFPSALAPVATAAGESAAGAAREQDVECGVSQGSGRVILHLLALILHVFTGPVSLPCFFLVWVLG